MGRRDIRDPAVRNLCGPLLRSGKGKERGKIGGGAFWLRPFPGKRELPGQTRPISCKLFKKKCNQGEKALEIELSLWYRNMRCDRIALKREITFRRNPHGISRGRELRGANVKLEN